MQEITVEPSLGEQLGELAGQAILCDPNGRVLGSSRRFLIDRMSRICSSSHRSRLRRPKNCAKCKPASRLAKFLPGWAFNELPRVLVAACGAAT